ncbi:MAG TPA: amidohydrolase family protein [Myxococcales bacterium]|nr:amidohydrolase family protein [Myxococcales bacterium]
MRNALLAILCAAAGPAFAQADQVVVLEGARLIDGTGSAPRENSVIVVQKDRITNVGTAGQATYPKGARVVDVRGRTIVPGFINAHGHVGLVANGKNSAEGYTRENVLAQLLQYEQYGVTSILALGLNRDLGFDIRDEQRRGGIPGASLFLAGRGIGVPDAAPPVPVAPDQVYRPQTPQEAVADVRETAKHHPDMLKLWVDDIYGKFPKMQPAVYQAAIQEAHKNKIRVAAHVFYLADAKALINAGVDALAHSIRDQAVDDELIKLMKSKGTFYVSTFTVDESAFVFAEDPSLTQDPFLVQAVGPELVQQWQSPEYKNKVANDPNTPKIKAALATGMKNLKTLQDAGVRIAFGTDSGAQPARIPGFAEHRELELMVRAGLTPMQALTAASRGSAAMLGLSDRGTIEKGKRADFLVLAANPLEDIKNTRQLVTIWHGGREVQPRARTVATK